MDGIPKERKCADRHQQRPHRTDLVDQGELRVVLRDAPGHAIQPKPVLRSKAEVEADEGERKVQAAEMFVEHAACELRIPVVDGGEDHKHRPAEDDVVKMCDDEVGVVDMDVERHLGEGDTGDAPQDKVDDEAAGEQHSTIETDSSPPECC